VLGGQGMAGLYDFARSAGATLIARRNDDFDSIVVGHRLGWIQSMRDRVFAVRLLPAPRNSKLVPIRLLLQVCWHVTNGVRSEKSDHQNGGRGREAADQDPC
jgi:hypothetical protein